MYRQIHAVCQQHTPLHGRRTPRRGRRSRALRRGTGRLGDAVRPARPGGPPRPGRRRDRPLPRGRPRLRRTGHPRPRRDRRLPGAAARLGGLHLGGRRHLGGDGRARRRRDSPGPRRSGAARLRLHRTGRPQGGAPHRRPVVRGTRPAPVRGPLRAHPHRQVRDGRPPPHAPVRHHTRAARAGRRTGPRQRRRQPRRHVPRTDHRGRRPVRAPGRRPVHQTALLHPLGRRLRRPAGGRGPRTRPRGAPGVDPRRGHRRLAHHDVRVGGLHRLPRRRLRAGRLRTGRGHP